MHSVQCCFSVQSVVAAIDPWLLHDKVNYVDELQLRLKPWQSLVFYIIVFQKNLTVLELTRLSSTLSLVTIDMIDLSLRQQNGSASELRIKPRILLSITAVKPCTITH